MLSLKCLFDMQVEGLLVGHTILELGDESRKKIQIWVLSL